MNTFSTMKLASTVSALLSLLLVSPPARSAESTALEPNLAQAVEWWPDLTDYWTPVGWKHHLFRYNVFFDGTIYANPGLSQTAKQWAGQGVQLRFLPELPGDAKRIATIRRDRYSLVDDRMTRQGWTTNSTPVLWTEWSKDGLLLCQQVFAHIPGGNAVESGTEPLFAWVRLSVHRIAPGLPVPERYGFVIQLNAPHVLPKMTVRQNIVMDHHRGAYPRPLRAESKDYDRAKGLRLVEPDGKVRLAIAPGADLEATFVAGDGNPLDPVLHFSFKVRPGEHVDLLVPMLPTDRNILDRELAVGYDVALSEADRFWAKRPATAATISVPEEYINDALWQFERFAGIISEKAPTTGLNTFLSGSLAYVKIWATPTGKTVSMFLDPLGYHDLAAEYLEPFIRAQGTRKPPSTFLEKHPGYLGSPEEFKAIDWMADHGSLLFAIANHARLLREPEQKRRYVEPVIKGCEFIQHARRFTGHGGVEGILPPAKYADRPWETQGVWSDGWNFKGLTEGARFLRQIKHPRAAEFTTEAEDYRRRFLAAFREAARKTGTWTDKHGVTHPFVPTSLHGFEAEAARHSFYLDTGPLMLVFAGLMDASDPLMQSALKWFREGPPHELKRFGGRFNQVAFLEREMSSSIPGYSWNIFHSWQLGDRRRFLEGMYSQYAGAISRQTKTICESRFGITGRVTHADTPFWMTRLAVIDDQIVENELHLLRLCPLAWISKQRETVFENMPTEFGPVSLRWQLSKDGKTLHLKHALQFRHPPGKVILHIPPVQGLKAVTVNGKRVSARAGAKLSL